MISFEFVPAGCQLSRFSRGPLVQHEQNVAYTKELARGTVFFLSFFVGLRLRPWTFTGQAAAGEAACNGGRGGGRARRGRAAHGRPAELHGQEVLHHGVQISPRRPGESSSQSGEWMDGFGRRK